MVAEFCSVSFAAEFSLALGAGIICLSWAFAVSFLAAALNMLAVFAALLRFFLDIHRFSLWELSLYYNRICAKMKEK